MIKFYGDGEITGLDDANIPVNLFTSKVKHKGKVKYRLSYDFFMPRKGMAEGGFLLADTKEELARLLVVSPGSSIAADPRRHLFRSAKRSRTIGDAVLNLAARNQREQARTAEVAG